MRSWITGLVVLTASCLPASADSKISVESAFALCNIFDGTRLTSQPCEVNGWDSSVIATLDMSSSEARQLCGQVAGLASQRGLLFDDGWTLQIRSPYSGDKSIAFCGL